MSRRRPEWKNRVIREWIAWHNARVGYRQRPPRRTRRAWGAAGKDPVADIRRAMDNARLHALRLDTMMLYQPKAVIKDGLL